MRAGPLPRVADLVPGIRGQGVLCADAADVEDVALALLTEGYVVAEIDGADVIDRGGAYAAMAGALHLGAEAGFDEGALVEALAQLPASWPHERGVVLLWRAAEQFAEGDEAAARRIRQLLTDASADLREADFAFETVAFVSGYDVPPLLLGVPRDEGSDR